MMFCLAHMAEADDDSCDHEYVDSPCEVRNVAIVPLDNMVPVVVMGGLSGAIYSAKVLDEPDGWFIPLAAIDQEAT